MALRRNRRGGGGSLGESSREFDSKGGGMVAAVGGVIQQSPSHYNQARMAAAQEKIYANDVTSKAMDLQRGSQSTQAEANEAVSLAKSGDRMNPTQGLAAVNKLNADAQTKYAAADQMEKAADVNPGPKGDSFRAQAGSLRASALSSQTRADNIVNDMASLGTADGYRSARDAQNTLDQTPRFDPASGQVRPTAAASTGTYSERASTFNSQYDAAKSNTRPPGGDGNPPGSDNNPHQV